MGGEDGPPSAAALQVRCKKPCTKLKVWGNFTLGQSGDPAWKWEGWSNQTLGHRITCEQGRAGIAGFGGSIRLGPFHIFTFYPGLVWRLWLGKRKAWWWRWSGRDTRLGVRRARFCHGIPIRCKVLLCVQQKTRMCNVGLWTKTCRCRRLCVCVFEVTQIPIQPRSATGAAAVEKPIPACAAVSYYDAPLALHFNTGPILTRYNTLNLI